MAGAAGCVLTVFTPTLILLDEQEVSGVMAGAAGSILTAFTLTPCPVGLIGSE